MVTVVLPEVRDRFADDEADTIRSAPEFRLRLQS